MNYCNFAIYVKNFKLYNQYLLFFPRLSYWETVIIEFFFRNKKYKPSMFFETLQNAVLKNLPLFFTGRDVTDANPACCARKRFCGKNLLDFKKSYRKTIGRGFFAAKF